MTLSLVAVTAIAAPRPADELPLGALDRAHPHTAKGVLPPALRDPRAAATLNESARCGIQGIDSISNFNGRFRAAGVDPTGLPNDQWSYNMIGPGPHKGRITVLPSPLIPVSVELLDVDGTVRVIDGHPLHSDATQFVPAVLASPIFENAKYTSSRPRPSSPTRFSVHNSGTGRRKPASGRASNRTGTPCSSHG